MGCITFAVKKQHSKISVIAKKHKAIKASVLFCNKIKTVISYCQFFNINILFRKNIKVSASFNKHLIANISLVCTVNYSDGNEMWWCDYWKVLWNNGVKALWLNPNTIK